MSNSLLSAKIKANGSIVPPLNKSDTVLSVFSATVHSPLLYSIKHSLTSTCQ